MSGREVERKREMQIKRMRDRARRESEMAWVEKWPLEKMPEYFKSIEQIKHQSKRI